MKVLLITGTDTNVGKTILTTSLVASWLKDYPEASIGLMKLIQTGTGDLQSRSERSSVRPKGATLSDRELYHELFDDIARVEIVTPLQFTAPLAPPLAADREGKEIDLAAVWQSFSILVKTKDLVVIEGIGGLGTPVTHELTVADLARDWRLKTILVVPVKLGAIAQAVANVMFARYAQVNLAGIILNCVTLESEAQLEDWAPIDLIQSLTQMPVLGTIPYLAQPKDLDKLAQVMNGMLFE